MKYLKPVILIVSLIIIATRLSTEKPEIQIISEIVEPTPKPHIEQATKSINDEFQKPIDELHELIIEIQLEEIKTLLREDVINETQTPNGFKAPRIQI